MLHGPPGTSKTTIAKKLAQDLGWPLLTMDQSVFLRCGVDNIDAEAERVFMLLSNLKEVVVLFDEVEELVATRDAPTGSPNPDKLSRLLTTSMLPRIHHLRDRRRIVFVFATNHLLRLDRAIVRLGRFDIIRGVMLPTRKEQEQILDKLLTHVDHGIRGAFDEARILDDAERFSYMDLYDLVRRVMAEAYSLGKPVDRNTITEARKQVKPIRQEELSKYESAMRDMDRP